MDSTNDSDKEQKSNQNEQFLPIYKRPKDDTPEPREVPISKDDDAPSPLAVPDAVCFVFIRFHFVFIGIH